MLNGKRVFCVVAGVLGIVILKRQWSRRHRSRLEKEEAEQSSRTKLLASSPLPIVLNPEKLRMGWAVAPPLFYPPHCAVIPLLSLEQLVAPESPLVSKMAKETNQSLFLVVEEIPVDPSMEVSKVFQHYLEHSELFRQCRGSTVQPLNFTSSDGSPAFTHYCETNETKLLFGLNGCYLFTACLQHFTGTLAELEGKTLDEKKLNSEEETYSAPHVAAMLLDAAVLPSFNVDTKRLENTITGAGTGFYSVRFSVEGKLVLLKVPPTLKLSLDGVKEESGLFFVEQLSPSTGMEGNSGSLRVLMKKTMFDKFQGDYDSTKVDTAWFKETGSEQDLKILRQLEVRVLNEKENVDQASVSYHQPHMGIFFSVKPEQGGVVFDPLLVDQPQVLYFPNGESTELDVPKFTIERLNHLPDTWEEGEKEEEVLLHNVKFHFTDWESTQTVCSLTEHSGLRAVQFTETKEGVTCRTLVIPVSKTILVVRWEVKEEKWQTFLPLLQQFLDTLHIDAA